MARIISFILFIGICLPVVSQNREILFDRISVREGLIDHSTNCITQDHLGFIWIGGFDGLHRFDGYEFKSYQYSPDNKKYQYFKDIYRIKEDKFGLLWILTEAGTILFDPSTEQNYLVPKYPGEKKSDLFNYRPDILIDSDGIVWATYREGLVRMEYKANIREFLKDNNQKTREEYIKTETIAIHNPSNDDYNCVTAVFEDEGHNIIVGCINGLNRQ